MKEKIDLDVSSHFYDDLLFHSGPFRRIEAFYQITAIKALARTHLVTNQDKWFGSFLSEERLLGDPGLNDAAIHCYQACRPAQTLLPVRVKKIEFNSATIEGPWYIQTETLDEQESDLTINVVVMNKNGDIKLTYSELVLRQVVGKGFKGDWNPVFLKPFLEYKLNSLSPNGHHEIALADCINVKKAFEDDFNYSTIDASGYVLQFKSEEPSVDYDNFTAEHVLEQTKLCLAGKDLSLKIIQPSLQTL